MLDDIKAVLGIDVSDDSKDGMLSVYIRRAVSTIEVYLNDDELTKEDIATKHADVVISIVESAYIENTNSSKGIKTKKQGDRSTTFKDGESFEINDSIRALLPIPYLRMR